MAIVFLVVKYSTNVNINNYNANIFNKILHKTFYLIFYENLFCGVVYLLYVCVMKISTRILKKMELGEELIVPMRTNEETPTRSLINYVKKTKSMNFTCKKNSEEKTLTIKRTE